MHDFIEGKSYCWKKKYERKGEDGGRKVWSSSCNCACGMHEISFLCLNKNKINCKSGVFFYLLEEHGNKNILFLLILQDDS